MSERTTDAIIVGAGLVGASVALALAQSGRQVTLLDARAESPVHTPQTADDFDARIYAISPGSIRFLQSLGAWEMLDAARLTPVYDMEIVGDAPNGAALTQLSAYESQVDHLCVMLEERELARVFTDMLAKSPSIKRLHGLAVKSLAVGDSNSSITLSDGQTIAARLLVAADGANSTLRTLSGIGTALTDYRQHGVVANFSCEKPHRNKAFQWFRPLGDEGVLAYLPLPGQRISIVWSCGLARAATLRAFDPATFAAEVAKAGDYRLGALNQIGATQAYPLTNLRATSVIGARLALVGDAAHVVHPLAGQGVNLGFRDAAALQTALLTVADCGASNALQTYASARRNDILALHAATHGLFGLFAHSSQAHPLLGALRNTGMNLANRLPVLKNFLVQQAMR